MPILFRTETERHGLSRVSSTHQRLSLSLYWTSGILNAFRAFSKELRVVKYLYWVEKREKLLGIDWLNVVTTCNHWNQSLTCHHGEEKAKICTKQLPWNCYMFPHFGKMGGRSTVRPRMAQYLSNCATALKLGCVMRGERLFLSTLYILIYTQPLTLATWRSADAIYVVYLCNLFGVSVASELAEGVRRAGRGGAVLLLEGSGQSWANTSCGSSVTLDCGVVFVACDSKKVVFWSRSFMIKSQGFNKFCLNVYVRVLLRNCPYGALTLNLDHHPVWSRMWLHQRQSLLLQAK